MPRRPCRTVPTVIVPDWNGSDWTGSDWTGSDWTGSGPEHWQTWLEEQSAALGRPTVRPAFADVDHPMRDEWLDDLRAVLATLPTDGYDVVAHSLGAVLWLHYVATEPDLPRAARVLLVAPPSPALSIAAVADFFPPPMDIDTVRRGADGTVLVAGDDDPYLPEGIAAAYGLPLKMATTIVPGGGHLNAESGYGEWPAVLDWCGRDNLAFY